MTSKNKTTKEEGSKKKKDLSNMQLDKEFKITTEEVNKEELIDALAEGAENLLPIVNAMTIKQLQRVLSILVYAPIMEHPTKKPRTPMEAVFIMNFLKLQDYKIALVELIDQELEDSKPTTSGDAEPQILEEDDIQEKSD